MGYYIEHTALDENLNITNCTKDSEESRRNLHMTDKDREVLTDCPVCGGCRFNSRTGLCIDCGYCEEEYGIIYEEEDNYED